MSIGMSNVRARCFTQPALRATFLGVTGAPPAGKSRRRQHDPSDTATGVDSTNSLADVAGLLVGNAGDLDALTGVTVVLPDRPLLAAADVRGGIPGTYHTDALSSGGLMRHVSALVLTGGAAYGIDAIAGLTSWLGARGRVSSAGVPSFRSSAVRSSLT